jgi:hypothetical protein
MDYEELKRWTRVTIACGVLVGRKPDAFSAPGRSAARGHGCRRQLNTDHGAAVVSAGHCKIGAPS